MKIGLRWKDISSFLGWPVQVQAMGGRCSTGEVEVKVDDRARRRKRPKKNTGTSLPDSGAERRAGSQVGSTTTSPA
jgi:hypothetical protein